MISTGTPVAWTACLPAGPAPAPASTASKARGFVVNGKATDPGHGPRPGPGPAGRQRLSSVLGRSRRSFWSRQGRRQQGASPPHPAFWEPQPCVCPSGSPGRQAASSGLPPSSELPGSPSEAGAHRHPLGEAGPGRRRGSSWRACQTAHGPAGTGPRSQRSPWVSLPPRASRPEVPASAGPSGARLPGRRGGTFRTGWALQSKGDVRRPEGISFSEQKGRRPLSPSCGCGLALGALAGVRTAKRGLRRLEGRTLPGAGVAFARKCRRTGFEGRRDQLGRRWEGLALLATRPERGEGVWVCRQVARPTARRHTPTTSRACPADPEERQPGVTAQACLLTSVPHCAVGQEMGPASPSTGRSFKRPYSLGGPSWCGLGAKVSEDRSHQRVLSQFVTQRPQPLLALL